MTTSAWAVAFARQAQSDLAARDQLLLNAKLPACHQLHFLQMAMDKFAKAHLITSGSDPGTLQRSHAYIGKVIPQIVRARLSRLGARSDTWVMDAVRVLARRIELLAPAVDAGGAVPANCEYPWQDASGTVTAPVDHDFALNLQSEPAGRTLLKAGLARIRELASGRSR